MPGGGSPAATELAQPVEPGAEDHTDAVAPDSPMLTKSFKGKSDLTLSTLIHPVGTVASNLPVSAERPEQIRQPSCAVDGQSLVFCETSDFCILPRSRSCLILLGVYFGWRRRW